MPAAMPSDSIGTAKLGCQVSTKKLPASPQTEGPSTSAPAAKLRDYVMARPPSIHIGVLQWRVTIFAAFHVHAGASSWSTHAELALAFRPTSLPRHLHRNRCADLEPVQATYSGVLLDRVQASTVGASLELDAHLLNV